MARILVYEDDESLSILFQQIITSSGRICKVVSTPQEISSEAQTAQYDMFLIDMQNILHILVLNVLAMLMILLEKSNIYSPIQS